MSAENFMSLRYLFSKTKFNLVSFISRFSILVLIIAYFSFLTILSVFSGLEDYSISFSKSFDPDIKIDWRVYTKNPDKPLIRDLIVEGLSLARTQKEEFGSILSSNNNDIKILIQKLDEFVKN